MASGPRRAPLPPCAWRSPSSSASTSSAASRPWRAGAAVYEASLPLTLNGRPFGSIRLGLSSTLIRRELAEALRQSLVITGLAMVLAWLVAMALANVVLRPVRALVRDVSRLRQGELPEGTPAGR